MKKYILSLALGLMVSSYTIATLASDSPLQILDTHIDSSSIAFDVKDENLTNGDQYFMECTEVGNDQYTNNPRQLRAQIANNVSTIIQMMVSVKASINYDCYVAVQKLNGQVVRHSVTKRTTSGGTGLANGQTPVLESNNEALLDKQVDLTISIKNISLISSIDAKSRQTVKKYKVEIILANSGTGDTNQAFYFSYAKNGKKPTSSLVSRNGLRSGGKISKILYLNTSEKGMLYNFKVDSKATIDESDETNNEASTVIGSPNSQKPKLPTLPAVANKQITDFFYGDSNYVKVMSGNTYDMNELNYFTNQTNINKDVFAFKVFSALKMLGYNTYAGMNDVGKKSQIINLNQFQKKYNLTISEKLDKSALSKISEELLKRENNEVKYRELFPLYGNITGLHKNDITKDHVAMLHTLPFQVLPDKFQLKTKDQFAACLQSQCGGQFRDDKFQYIYIQGEPLVFLQPDSNLIISLLHEYAHYLDGALYQKYEELVRGVIDTTNFYNISFKDVDKVGQLPFYEKNCFDRRTNDDYEFITSYARSHGTLNRPLCPNEKYAVAEDFAESFSAYVASGKQFRMAALKNTTINKKYQWLKTNIFGGIEYNTDLIWGNSSGCNDIESVKTQTPGYMSCNEEYIWSGTLPKLGQ